MNLPRFEMFMRFMKNSEFRIDNFSEFLDKFVDGMVILILAPVLSVTSTYREKRAKQHPGGFGEFMNCDYEPLIIIPSV